MKIQVIASSSAGNCYVIHGTGAPLMIECGVRFREIRKAMGFTVSSAVGCLVSHAHPDHSIAVKGLLKAGIDVYASPETFAALGVSGHRAKVICPEEAYRIGNFTVIPFATEHDKSGSLGFYVANGDDRLLFVTDTAFIRPTFGNLSMVMVECNYSESVLRANVAAGRVTSAEMTRTMATHFGLMNVCEFIRANDMSKVRQIMLIHLSDRNADEAEMVRTIQALVPHAEVTAAPATTR